MDQEQTISVGNKRKGYRIGMHIFTTRQKNNKKRNLHQLIGDLLDQINSKRTSQNDVSSKQRLGCYPTHFHQFERCHLFYHFRCWQIHHHALFFSTCSFFFHPDCCSQCRSKKLYLFL